MSRPFVIPLHAEKFVPYFDAAEAQYNIPKGTLSRVAMQESSFRPDVISGAVNSPAGAVGLMQIVPRWHPNVDPTDPIASINYAASYLAKLHGQFGTWKLALAAYNWGPGNLRKYLNNPGGVTMPVETANYIRQISADVEGIV